uniref:Leucine rich repeat containing 46 n=1 Tax=Pavo cristatus TaxID=9049 RepID=A0A8C9ELL9_PAVCR
MELRQGRVGGAGLGPPFSCLLMVVPLLRSLLEVSLSSDLHTLNMHCNRIARIEGLGHLRNLQQLDLSSNQIRRMEGLSALENLRSLNLSCNLIMAVEGLQCFFLPDSQRIRLFVLKLPSMPVPRPY